MIRVMDAIVPHVGAGQELTSVGLDCARVNHTGGLGEQDEFCGLRGDPEKAVRRDREPFRTPVPSAPDPRDGPSRGRHSGGGRPRRWAHTFSCFLSAGPGFCAVLSRRGFSTTFFFYGGAELTPDAVRGRGPPGIRPPDPSGGGPPSRRCLAVVQGS